MIDRFGVLLFRVALAGTGGFVCLLVVKDEWSPTLPESVDEKLG